MIHIHVTSSARVGTCARQSGRVSSLKKISLAPTALTAEVSLTRMEGSSEQHLVDSEGGLLY